MDPPPSFDAVFYDGKSSRGAAARVAVLAAVAPHGERFEVQVLGENAARIFPVQETRIAPRLGDTPRLLHFPGGPCCETLDNAAVDALVAQTGYGLAQRLRHGLESSAGWALGAVLLMAGVAGAGTIWGIPLLAKAIAGAMPASMVRELGKGVLSSLDTLLFSDSELTSERQAEVRSVFGTLAQRYPELPLKLSFRKLGMPNAFALPDGQLVVTDELVEVAESNEELLSILAHEVGHVHERHGLRIALESSSVALLLSAYVGDFAEVSVIAAGLPAAYAQSSYSRGHETEADTFALQALSELGISPSSFGDILERIAESSGTDAEAGPEALRYLRSHPLPAQRIERFRSAARSPGPPHGE